MVASAAAVARVPAAQRRARLQLELSHHTKKCGIGVVVWSRC